MFATGVYTLLLGNRLFFGVMRRHMWSWNDFSVLELLTIGSFIFHMVSLGIFGQIFLLE